MMSFEKQGGPAQAASQAQHIQDHYTARIREQLAAIGMNVPNHLPWFQYIDCSAIGNSSEPAGQLFITDKYTIILDYQRARQIKVYA